MRRRDSIGRKARIGLTRDLFDKDWRPLTPGPGLKLLDEMPELEYEIFPEYLLEVTPEQICGFDMVITLKPRWTERTLVGNN
jgi:hypothetical protein